MAAAEKFADHGLFVDASRCSSTYVQWLMQRWSEVHGISRLPSVWDLGLWSYPGCVPYLSLMRLETDPFRVKYWYVGSEATKLYGDGREGHYLDKLPGARKNWVEPLYRQLVATGKPILGYERYGDKGGSGLGVQFGLFPLSASADAVELCLCLDDFRADISMPPAFEASRLSTLANIRTSAYPSTKSKEFLLYCQEETMALFAYWDEKRRGRIAPARADIDPVEMQQWLPGIILVDAERGGKRLLYRLMGTRCVAARGFDPTGKTVEEGYFGKSRADVVECYRQVIEDKSVIYDWDSTPTVDGFNKHNETLFLPLSSDGETIDMAMVFYARSRVKTT